MPIVRVSKHQHNFLLMDKTGLEDSRLSYRAKGLLAYLLSKPDTWEVHVEELATHSPSEGREAIRSALRELEHAGYAQRQKKQRSVRGQLAGWETVVYETPQTTDYGSADSGQPVVGPSTDYGLADYGSADSGQPVVLVSIDSNKDLKKVSIEKENTSSAVVENPTTCGVPSAPSQDIVPPASEKKKPTKPRSEPWPEECAEFADWLATQQLLTLITPPTEYDWWCDVSYIINGLPAIPWLEREYAQMQMWLKENPRKKPTPRGTSKFVRGWLERTYERERRQTQRQTAKELHIHYASNGRR